MYVCVYDVYVLYIWNYVRIYLYVVKFFCICTVNVEMNTASKIRDKSSMNATRGLLSRLLGVAIGTYEGIY